jgi:Lipocalin-like domain
MRMSRSAIGFLTVAAGLAAVALGAQSVREDALRAKSERDRLIGAWHLVSLGEVGPDGKLNGVDGLKGTLVYTRDGHMSVQIMYPPAQSGLSNDYVRNGYEASFGRYDVDEAKHTLTHHVEGSITPGLVGKDLIRRFSISYRRLIIQSMRADEHWQVVWEHD